MLLEVLKKAFDDRELTLYLGAGVSMPSGLPSWDRLVLTMYLAAIGDLEPGDNPLHQWRVFPNYLEAIAEWLLGESVDPAEITAQKIRSMLPDDTAFIKLLKETLYSPISDSGPLNNDTLTAVHDLCKASGEVRGVRAIVTYNYDDLVENSLPMLFAPAWREDSKTFRDRIPVFHVHGFLPQNGEGSKYDELVLTEEQFHKAASDPYSWSNLVQMRQLGSNVGLMIGMSLSDRNLRRILEAMSKLPDLCPQFALLKRPTAKLRDEDLEEIEDMAKQLGRSRKSVDRGHEQIAAIFGKLVRYDQQRTEKVLKTLGVRVMWMDAFDQIPQLLTEIRRTS